LRAYLIDELNGEDMQRLLSLLEVKAQKASVTDMYWLELPAALLSPEQHAHAKQCGPFVSSLETGPNWLKAELLIRGRGKLRCSCIAYAEAEQRAWIMNQIDDMLQALDIPV